MAISNTCADFRQELQRHDYTTRPRPVLRSMETYRLPDLPTWTSRGGSIALLGGSAHAMYPNAAQCFSQTAEDIGVLEYLISLESNPVPRIPRITKVWQEIGKAKVERIKAFAKWNTALFSGELLVSNETQVKVI